jgi:anti-anti-sigma factor
MSDTEVEDRAGPWGPTVLRMDDASLFKVVADLRWRTEELLAEPHPHLVVDISGLTRLSSATLAALLWAQRYCRARGGAVRLTGPNRRNRELLARTGLAELFCVDGSTAWDERRRTRTPLVVHRAAAP